MSDYLQARRGQIKAEAERFQRASPAERRVWIAKDVLVQLDVGHIKPVVGRFIPQESYMWHGGQMQDVFLSMQACECCALGAAFMCLIERENKLLSTELAEYFIGTFLDRLKDLFGEEQYKLIEVFYEGGCGWFKRSPVRDQAAVWFGKHLDDKERMQLIMQNIIDHGGEFVPTALS